MIGKEQKPEIALNRSMEEWLAMDQTCSQKHVLQVCSYNT